MTNEKFDLKAELVDGHLNIAIKVPIPTVTCDLCKRTYKQVRRTSWPLDQDFVSSTLGLSGLFEPPDREHWRWVCLTKKDGEYRPPKSVCPTCAAPINEAESSCATAKTVAHEAVAAKFEAL